MVIRRYLPKDVEELVHWYERYISPLSLVAGFLADNFILLRRVDLWRSNALLFSYLIVAAAGIAATTPWAHVSNPALQALATHLTAATFEVDGKSLFKDEFVTCGGVKLAEVDFKTMESRLCPGLYFAGEVLDVDGVTGGFNFQNAWTTGWLAGQAAAE